MKLHFYRSDQLAGSALLINIYIDDKIKVVLPPGEQMRFELPPGSHKLRAKTGLSPNFLVNTYFHKFIRILTIYNAKTSRVIRIDSPHNSDEKIYYFLCFDSPSFTEELKRVGRRMIKLFGIGEGPHSISLTEINKDSFKNKSIDKPLHVDFKRKRPTETTEEKQLVLWNISLGTLMLVFGMYVFNQPIGDAAKMGTVMFLMGFGPTVRMLRYMFNRHLILRYKLLRGLGIIMPIYFALFATQVYNYSRLFGISILFIVAYLYIFFRAKSVLKR